MLRRTAFRLVQNYAQNSTSLIGSKRSIDLRRPRECPVDPMPKDDGLFSGLRDSRPRLNQGYLEALRSKKINLQMASENIVARMLKGDEIISRSSGCSPLLDFSLNQQRIARLSGYLEAIRSKKQYRQAIYDLEDKISKKKIKSYLGEDDGELERENRVLPEVLPFPVEPCYLEDLIRLNALRNVNANMPAVKSIHSMGSHGNADLILCIMRDLIYKLWGLHYSEVIHGNLKPQNVLLFEGECMLTSVINDGTDSLEWKAPEQILYKTQTKASDMFTFGCVLYFFITGGYHPFGDTPDQCITNILTNKMNISRVKDIPDAYHLISLLLSPKPDLRPKANDVFCHPFFEELTVKVQLVYDICYCSRHNEDILNELESKIPILRNHEWLNKFMAYSMMYYNCSKQAFEDFKDVFGPQGSPSFFPSIFMGAYEVARKHWRDHPMFEEMHLTEDEFAVVEKIGFSCYFQ